MDNPYTKNTIIDANITADGHVIVGDKNNIITVNLKEAAEYKELQRREEDLNIRYNQTKYRIEKFPEEEDFKTELAQILKELGEVKDAAETLKKAVIELANEFLRIPINTERLRLARQYFESGEFGRARWILDAETLSSELQNLKQEEERLNKRSNELIQQFKDKSNEFLILAQLTRVNFSLPDRFEKTDSCYLQSLSAYKTGDNGIMYAKFLAENNENVKAIAEYQDALAIYEKLVQEDNVRVKPFLMPAVINELASLMASNNECLAALDAYKSALKMLETVTNIDKTTYLIVRSDILENLGVLYTQTYRFSNASNTFQEAVFIRRELVTKDSRQSGRLAATLTKYSQLCFAINDFESAEKVGAEGHNIWVDIATSKGKLNYYPEWGEALHQLGKVYAATKRYGEAIDAFQKVVNVSRSFGESNPRVFTPPLADALHELGIVYAETNEFKKAKEAYQEALTIKTNLAKNNTDAYLPSIADTLNKFAVLCWKMKQLDEAKAKHLKALVIRRRFAEINADKYEPALANTLANLAVVLQQSDEFEEASLKYDEALTIQRRLADKLGRTFLPPLVATLTNFALFQRDRGNYLHAEAMMDEALQIRKNLAKTKQQLFKQDVARSAYNLSLLYQKYIPHRGKSLAYAKEAITCLLPQIDTNPDIQKMLKGVRSILTSWEVNYEDFVQEVRNESNSK